MPEVCSNLLSSFINMTAGWIIFSYCHQVGTSKFRLEHGIPKLSAKHRAYVEEMAGGDTVSGAVNIQRFKMTFSSNHKNRVTSLYEGVVRSLNNPNTNPIPLIVVAVHPPSFFDHKLLASLRSPHSPQTRLTTLETQDRQHLGIL